MFLKKKEKKKTLFCRVLNLNFSCSYINRGGPRGVLCMSQQHAKNFVQHAKIFVQHANILCSMLTFLWNILENTQTILLSAMPKTSFSNNFHDFYPWITTHLWSNIQNKRLKKLSYILAI